MCLQHELLFAPILILVLQSVPHKLIPQPRYRHSNLTWVLYQSWGLFLGIEAYYNI